MARAAPLGQGCARARWARPIHMPRGGRTGRAVVRSRWPSVAHVARIGGGHDGRLCGRGRPESGGRPGGRGPWRLTDSDERTATGPCCSFRCAVVQRHLPAALVVLCDYDDVVLRLGGRNGFAIFSR